MDENQALNERARISLELFENKMQNFVEDA